MTKHSFKKHFFILNVAARLLTWMLIKTFIVNVSLMEFLIIDFGILGAKIFCNFIVSKVFQNNPLQDLNRKASD